MKSLASFKTFVFRTLCSAALLSTVMCASAAHATIAVQNLSGGSTFPAFNGTDQTIGWQFTTSSDISVTDLGFYDVSPADPLGQTHQVGLWTTGGTLLTSVTIQTTSVLLGNFRYEAIAPIFLSAGMSYLIGAAITSPFLDVYRVPASTTLALEITINGSARNASGGGFSAPTTVTAGTGRIGPNFQYTLVNTVPEPGTLLLLLMGAAGLASRRLMRGTLSS